MFSLVVKKFVKNYKDIKNPEVRTGYGMASGATGIALNVILFLVKYLAGFISGSIAIMADAVNNLSDAGSSLITLLGFRLASAKPDQDHPFGHGRIEYLSALAVSIIIILMGFEIGKSSVEKIITPVMSEVSALIVAILVFSIAIKLYMYRYNKKYGELIDSSAMKATATDSISDAIATTVVLISMLVIKFFSVDIDGWCGILVAAFILKAGISSVRDTVGDLLGKAPSKELIDKIEDIVLSHEEVIGMHDLIIHDYGPGRMMVSLHGEVSGDGDMMHLHDIIDNIEKELSEKLGCAAVIHMDPIVINDEKVTEMRSKVLKIVEGIDPKLSIHDFRMVTGPTHTNIIFDIVVPYDFKMSNNKLKDTISEEVKKTNENCFCVISIDRPFV